MSELQVHGFEEEIKDLKADINILKRLFVMVKLESVEMVELTETEKKWVRKAIKDTRAKSRRDWIPLEKLKAEFG